jgi:hypothetical protein
MPTESERHSRRRTANRLLRRAKSILAQWHRLHFQSVAIGRCEQAGLTELCTSEIVNARGTIEEADQVCAEIDKHLSTIHSY